MSAIAVGNRDVLRRAQKSINLARRQVSQPGSRRVGPMIPQRLGRQQGSWCDQGLEKMLVERQYMFAAGELRQARAEPMRERGRHFGECLSARTGETKATRAARARRIRTGQGNALVRCASKQGRLAATRMTYNCDPCSIHKVKLEQRVHGAVVTPGPGSQCWTVRREHATVRNGRNVDGSRAIRRNCVGRKLNPVELCKHIPRAQHRCDHLIICVVPATIPIEDNRKPPNTNRHKYPKRKSVPRVHHHPTRQQPRAAERSDGCRVQNQTLDEIRHPGNFAIRKRDHQGMNFASALTPLRGRLHRRTRAKEERIGQGRLG